MRVQRVESFAYPKTAAATPETPSRLRRLLRLMRRKPLGTVGALIVLGMLVLAVFAEAIAPYHYNKTHVRDRLKPPSRTYILGTDNLGRDIFSRIVYGARVSMIVSLSAVLVGITLATLIGTTSGYFGGAFDTLVQRLVDAWMAFPGLIVILSIMSIVGSGILNLIIALGILVAAGSSRIIRSATLGVKENTYIEAARAVGASHLRILLWYILPNVMAPIIISATLVLGFIILIEAALSFLGFGVPPPYPSWGLMLNGSGRVFMLRAPWMALWPGVAVSLAVFGFNMLGDALRDVLDPRLRGA
jgi:peptide/nickel transport system permease protein